MPLAAEQTQRRTPSPRLRGQGRVRDGGLVLSQHSFSEILYEKKKKAWSAGAKGEQGLCAKQPVTEISSGGFHSIALRPESHIPGGLMHIGRVPAHVHISHLERAWTCRFSSFGVTF